MGINHFLEHYVAEITALFLPYLVSEIKEGQWLHLQSALAAMLQQMFKEQKQDNHAKKKQKPDGKKMGSRHTS